MTMAARSNKHLAGDATNVNYTDSLKDIRPEPDAIIVGAGFGGLYALHRLKQIGLSVEGFEAGAGVGGTWYWNRYPGARCDIESMQYSYSFSDKLQQEWKWQEKYAPQAEILRYIEHVAERFDLLKLIQFNTRIVSASFDDNLERWIVTTDRGESKSARYLILATGPLSTANTPAIRGLDRFSGRIFHTGAWPHEPVDFIGRSVGVIGTGSSGIQIIPELAQVAKDLIVFQRTPNFSIPSRNGPLTPARERMFKERYKVFREEIKRLPSGIFFETTGKSTEEVSPEERQSGFEEAWAKGGVGFVRTFTDIILNPEANTSASDFIRAKIAEIVENPTVASALQPKTYPLGAKRICVDTGYYETFNKSNVSLIDVSKTPITHITSKAVSTVDADYPLDDIVFATGFDALTGAILAIDIKGSAGRSLKDKWKEGPSTYLGLMAAGFPNMFMVAGPGSPSILGNVVVSIEQHVDWISACLEYMHNHDVDVIDAKPDAEAQWDAHVNEVAQSSLFQQADSWYLGSNIPGKPRKFLAYAGGYGVYRDKCAEIASSGYEGFIFRKSPVLAASN